jgi:hypothetical protein
MSRPDAGEPPEEGGKSRSNIAALVVIVLLFAGAYWVFNLLERQREIQNCVASGRRDCLEMAHPEVRTPQRAPALSAPK